MLLSDSDMLRLILSEFEVTGDDTFLVGALFNLLSLFEVRMTSFHF